MGRALVLAAAVSLAAGALRRVSPIQGVRFPTNPCGHASDCESCHAQTPTHALGFGLAAPPRACCWCEHDGPNKCFARDDATNPCECKFTSEDTCDAPPGPPNPPKPPKPPTKAPTPKPPPMPKPTPKPTATPTNPTARPTYPTPSPTPPTASPTRPTKRPTTAKPTKSPTPPPTCKVPDVKDDGIWSGVGCTSKASVALGTHCKLTVEQGSACGDMAEGTSRGFTCVRKKGPGGAEWTPRVPKCKRTPPPTPPPTKRPTRPTAAPTDPTAAPTDPTHAPTPSPTKKPTRKPTPKPTKPTPKPTPIPECVVPDVHKDGSWSGASCESHAVVSLGTQCTLTVSQGSACGDMAEGTSRTFTCQLHEGKRGGWEWSPSIPKCKRTPPPTAAPTAPTARPTRPTAHPTNPTARPTRPTARPTRPTASPTNPTARPTRPTKRPTRAPPTDCTVPDLGDAAVYRHDIGPPILSAHCSAGGKVKENGMCQVEVKTGYECDGFVGPKAYDVRCVKKSGPSGGVHWDKKLKCGKKKLLLKRKPVMLA